MMSIFVLAVAVSAATSRDLELGVSNIQGDLDQHWALLSNTVKKVQDISREVRMINVRGSKIITKLTQSTDVAIYAMFNSEIQRKCGLAEQQYKSIEKNVGKGAVMERIEKVIDYYVKRQHVPDPEMHQHLFQLERKVGEVASLMRDVYNIDWLYLSLIVMGIAMGGLWRLVKTAQKRHVL
jgi:uncharacterized protein YoxC